MIFQASEQQIKQIVKNAFKASTPMGLGFLHADPKHELQDDEIEIRNHMSFDYVKGRMMKLGIFRVDENNWEILDDPMPDYQSWCLVYPTTEDLVNSVLKI